MSGLAKNTIAGGRPSLLLLSILAIGSALLLTVTTLFWGYLELTSIVVYSLLGLAFVVMAILAVWKWSLGRDYGGLDLFELPTWFTINVFAFMVVPGRTAFGNPGSLYARLDGDYQYLILALVYVSLGTLALWLGYRFTLGKLGPKPRVSMVSRAMSNAAIVQPTVVLSLYVVSVGIRLYQIATGQYSYLQDAGASEFLGIRQWLTYGAQMWVIVLPATALTAFRRKVPLLSSTTLLVMVLTEVAFTFIGGSKGTIIYLLVLVAASAFYAGRQIPWRWAVVLGLFFILVFPINQLYRRAIVAGEVDTRNPLAAAATIARLTGESWLSLSLVDNLQSVMDGITGRQTMIIQSISLAAYMTPDIIPYRYGYDYFRLPAYILIPRVIWPSKPMLSGSVQFSIDYAGESVGTNNSTAVTPFADLYLNFGLPGILGGMFLLGCFYCLFYRSIRAEGSDPSLVLYLGLLSYMTNIEAEIVGMIQGTLQQLIIFYVLIRVMYRVRAASQTGGLPK